MNEWKNWPVHQNIKKSSVLVKNKNLTKFM